MSTGGDDKTPRAPATMELNDSGQRPIHYLKVLSRLLSYLLPYRNEITVAMAAILVYGGTAAALPWRVREN